MVCYVKLGLGILLECSVNLTRCKRPLIFNFNLCMLLCTLKNKLMISSRPTVAERSKASVILDHGRGRSWVQIPAVPNLIIVFLLEIGSI